MEGNYERGTDLLRGTSGLVLAGLLVAEVASTSHLDLEIASLTLALLVVELA
jgi:hypothetical protein